MRLRNQRRGQDEGHRGNKKRFHADTITEEGISL
jgi:hypothetical protein